MHAAHIVKSQISTVSAVFVSPINYTYPFTIVLSLTTLPADFKASCSLSEWYTLTILVTLAFGFSLLNIGRIKSWLNLLNLKRDWNNSLQYIAWKYFMIFSSVEFFSKLTFSKNYFRNIIRVLNSFGSRSGPTFCRAWSGSILLTKAISRRHWKVSYHIWPN